MDDILMSMAVTFTDEGKRIRWRQIADATGHHESSCALKYHVIRSRAAGRLARELIDADLAVKDPVKPATPAYGGKGYPVWTEDEDARVLAACLGEVIKGNAAWQKIAEGFPGRSLQAVRQRYVTLRNHAAGIVRDRDRDSRPVKHVPVKTDPRPARLPAFEYQTLTSAFFKDPPPGRSALDKQRAGIVDEPFVDYRKALEHRFPKITLATEPMR
jgi:hypothetical protein